jgi:MFS family permease
MKGRGNSYNFLIVFTVALGSFTYGYSSAIIGSVFGLPSFFSYFNLSLSGSNSARIIGGTFLKGNHNEISTTKSTLAANGLFAGGGMIGCILVGWPADKIGRVKTIQALCTIGVIAAIIQAASVHIAMFLVGRLLGGMRYVSSN